MPRGKAFERPQRTSAAPASVRDAGRHVQGQHTRSNVQTRSHGANLFAEKGSFVKEHELGTVCPDARHADTGGGKK